MDLTRLISSYTYFLEAMRELQIVQTVDPILFFHAKQNQLELLILAGLSTTVGLHVS
jgi:hypothetical protein